MSAQFLRQQRMPASNDSWMTDYGRHLHSSDLTNKLYCNGFSQLLCPLLSPRLLHPPWSYPSSLHRQLLSTSHGWAHVVRHSVLDQSPAKLIRTARNSLIEGLNPPAHGTRNTRWPPMINSALRILYTSTQHIKQMVVSEPLCKIWPLP